MINFALREAFRDARFLLVPGHFGYIGGAERQSLILATSLRNELDCHVDFLGWGGEDGIFADALRDIGISPVIFPWEFEARGIKRAVNGFRLARYIRNNLKPDYILPFVTYHCKVIGSVWRWTGARFTWWNQRDEGRYLHGTKTEHRLMRSLPAVVSNSWEGRDFLVDKFRLPEERVRVINNGVEIPVDISPSNWRQRLGIAQSDIVFTMTANLSAFKDHLTLLHAFARLRQSEIGRRCRLILAGRQDETTQQIKGLAFDLGLCGAVILPGIVPMNETGSLLQATDVVIHSSIKEGCPNAALEAMAHGRCVLGTNISGMRQALGKDAAEKYLSPPGDAGHLSELMQQMANDPAGREAAGDANLARVRTEFSVEKMTEAVLETILNHRIR